MSVVADLELRHWAADLIEAKAKGPATRNRYFACLRALLTKTVGAWEWLDRVPKLRMYSEPRKRVRWISKEEAQRFLAALPGWLADLARFAQAKGLRQGNVVALEWSQVDLERHVAWVHPEQAKARRVIGVPLNEHAVAALRRQKGTHEQRVFVVPDGEFLVGRGKAPRGGWKSGCMPTFAGTI